jgi:hypothetical protein
MWLRRRVSSGGGCVKLDGVGEGRGMVDSCLWGPKVSEDMVVPVAVFRLRIGDRVRTTHEGLARSRKKNHSSGSNSSSTPQNRDLR